MPEELVLFILSLLDQPALMTARLVCSAWRALSLELLTSQAPTRCVLWTGESVISEWRLPDPMPIPRPRHLAWAVPQRVTDMWWVHPLDRSKRLPLVFTTGSNLRPTVHITASSTLLLDMLSTADSEGLTYAALTSLALKFYRVDYQRPAPVLQALSTMLKQPSHLRELHLQSDVFVWRRLLPCIKDLQHLQCLGVVPLESPKVVQELSSLTGLTGLWCGFQGNSDARSLPAQLAPLAALTALRALSFRNWPYRISYSEEALSRVQPEELCSHVFRPTGSLLDSILASLSQLTALQIAPDRPVYGKAFECVVTSREEKGGPLTLLHLAWCCLAPSCKAWALPSSLHHLSITAGAKTCPALVENLRMLTCLTLLRVEEARLGRADGFQWDMGARTNDTWRVGAFLTTLTGLVDLELKHVLHPANVETDVRCLACLTRLTRLHVSGGVDPTGGPDADALKSAAAGFESGGGFRQLRSLRSLRAFHLEQPWRCVWQASITEVKNAICAHNRDMGWPLPPFHPEHTPSGTQDFFKSTVHWHVAPSDKSRF